MIDESARLASKHKQDVDSMIEELINMGVTDEDLLNEVEFAQTDEDYQETNINGFMADECVYEKVKECIRLLS